MEVAGDRTGPAKRFFSVLCRGDRLKSDDSDGRPPIRGHTKKTELCMVNEGILCTMNYKTVKKTILG